MKMVIADKDKDSSRIHMKEFIEKCSSLIAVIIGLGVVYCKALKVFHIILRGRYHKNIPTGLPRDDNLSLIYMFVLALILDLKM